MFSANAITSPTPNAAERAIPDWLVPFIVEQDVSRYSVVDQAVWRFVLLQMYDRLKHSAHPAYVQGLAQSGISCERIPSVSEMNQCLARLGWGAVCVDGFIPPRAFQAFQALRLLPIAAEIRSPEQLAYTPAPDIIHEAAGHAPILADSSYAAYVQASGEVALRAFTSPKDQAVYAAISALSRLKEASSPDATALADAERALERAIATVEEVSEAARISRLYWWTSEYGLVGQVNDYKLYGAGLLSSLWESHVCHSPDVRKVALSAECVEVDYDITREQPQLFVARDFEQLHQVLDEVANTLAYRRGGRYGLECAIKSGETCTLDCGADAVQVSGRVTNIVVSNERVHAVGFSSGASIRGRSGQVFDVFGAEGYFLPIGPLRDATSPAALAAGAWRRYVDVNGRLNLEYPLGLRLNGNMLSTTPDIQLASSHSACLVLGQCEIWRGDARLFHADRYPLLLVDQIASVAAGLPETLEAPSNGQNSRPGRPKRVPKVSVASAGELRREALYADAFKLELLPRAQRAPGLARVQAALGGDLSNEWLLRFWVLNLLELPPQAGLSATLREELEALELHYQRRFPIATGLRYLTNLGRA